MPEVLQNVMWPRLHPRAVYICIYIKDVRRFAAGARGFLMYIRRRARDGRVYYVTKG